MADNLRPMQDYLDHWARRIRRRFRVVSYETAAPPTRYPNGLFVFTDVDRLSPVAAPIAVSLWDSLSQRGDGVRLLNRPGVALPRYELLRMLHAAGRNRFNVYRLDEDRAGIRYPVFVRHTREHAGAYTPLLMDALKLESAIAELVAAGHAALDLLIVEYLDTSIDGLFRKYSVTRIDDRLIAHHIMFERKWHVKAPSLIEPEMVAEERAYQESNLHAAQVKELFDLANLEFGRIDYGLYEGHIQVWEINSNPTLLAVPARFHPIQMPAKYWFAEQTNRAFCELDDRLRPAREPAAPLSAILRVLRRPDAGL